MLVFAPCGSGKSHFIDNYKGDYTIIDGDVLLEEKGVKNRNYFWYDESRSLERIKITETLQEAVSDGNVVLYSGNPLQLKPKIIVLPNAQVRWDQVHSRKGFIPTKAQFYREEDAYFEASMGGAITLTSFDNLLEYLADH